MFLEDWEGNRGRTGCASGRPGGGGGRDGWIFKQDPVQELAEEFDS